MARFKAPKCVRIFEGKKGGIYWATESRSGVEIERTPRPAGYKDARYVRKLVAARFPGLKVVDSTMNPVSAKANATKVMNARLIDAMRTVERKDRRR